MAASVSILFVGENSLFLTGRFSDENNNISNRKLNNRNIIIMMKNSKRKYKYCKKKKLAKLQSAII